MRETYFEQPKPPIFNEFNNELADVLIKTLGNLLKKVIAINKNE